VTGARQATVYTAPNGTPYTSVTLSNHSGWQEVDYLANQTNFFLTQDIAGMKNELIFSLEYTDHGVNRGNYNPNTSGTNCFSRQVNAQTGVVTWPGAFCATDVAFTPLSGRHTVMNKQPSKNLWTSDWNV